LLEAWNSIHGLSWNLRFLEAFLKADPVPDVPWRWIELAEYCQQNYLLAE